MKAMLNSKDGDPRDRQKLLETIRAVVAKLPAERRLTLLKFLAEAGFSERNVFRHFPKWSEALLAAGVNFKRYNAPIPPDEMLADWGRLARELRRRPTHKEYRIHGKHDPSTFRNRFGAWSKVPDAFREFAGSAEEWSDIIALLPPVSARHNRKQRAPVVSQCRRRRAARLPGRPICGAPIDFASLRYAPANESGVLFLFAIMARDLGFMVDSLQMEFPDCEAKRLIAPNTWQTVRIEFEFESRNFRDHGHDPAACDLIVCWEHNWPECPEHIEVIALSEQMARLGAKTQTCLSIVDE